MEAWCDYCGVERQVVTTVAWQPNFCSECGNSIESTATESVESS